MSKNFKTKYLLYDSQRTDIMYGGSESIHPSLEKDYKSLYLKYASAESNSLDDIFRKKYIMYKNKYINLKKQLGGLITCEGLGRVGLNNYNGTCWNIVIQTIFFFGDKSRDEVQMKLSSVPSVDLINNAKKKLELFLPNNLLDDNDELLPDTYGLLVQIIDDIKKRFNIKEHDYNDTGIPYLLRQESKACEVNFAHNFF